ncbi:FkbM family methyltransferase [Flavobacterium magnum]|uniref:FkbM family methyltransferase n=1 Tax=Flavobacterium magnum TaxID=2162713 RepID=UPI0015E6E8E8|nr:FkbM family methyltransferase [Flavobacterium magnum]
MIRFIKDFLYRRGYKINKVSTLALLHEDYLKAVSGYIRKNPVLFDVGANVGQTVSKFKVVFPTSEIHSFEPSKVCFDVLKDSHKSTHNLVLNNVAVGSEKGSLDFNEYSWSSLNSLLKRSFTKSELIDSYKVDVITIDEYCKSNSIFKIDLLKTDTEGYELQVLKGASQMMDENRIQFVYVEVFFYENYIGQSSFGDVYNYLSGKGFNFVRFYAFEYTGEGLASRTDALFINKNFIN